MLAQIGIQPGTRQRQELTFLTAVILSGVDGICRQERNCEVFIKKVILAMRFGLQEIRGKSLPIQVLIPLGSNRTLRGYSLDRFLDKSAALFNAEIRFPIYWRFGGIIGMDTGRVWESIEKFSFMQWHTNAVLGLRFYLQTYIVRLDMGFSHEITGLYLNFNHIF